MDDIVLTRTLRSKGYDGRDLRSMRRNGSLIPVRRGAYVRERPAERTCADEHRELILATVPQLHNGAVISHASAAVMYGLPTWPPAIDRVHLTRNRSGGGNRRSIVQVHAAPLPDDHVTMIDGIPVTSLTRTVLDLCRTVPIEQAVAAGDRALAFGLVRELLEDALAQMTRWPGVRQARRAVALFDARSESPGESVSRVRLHEDGLPAPDPQQDIFDENGSLLPGLTFAGRNSEPSGNSMERSSTGSCGSPANRWRMRSSPKSSARIRCGILVGRSCGGYGLTCIAAASFATGCCEPLLGPPPDHFGVVHTTSR
jgi:hypothetical protein